MPNMWNSEIIQKEFNNGKMTLTVKYSNGTDSFQERYDFFTNPDQLNDILLQKLNDLNSLYADKSTLEIGRVATADTLQLAQESPTPISIPASLN